MERPPVRLGGEADFALKANRAPAKLPAANAGGARLAAARTLLGINVPTAKGFAGDAARPSFKEAEDIRKHVSLALAASVPKGSAIVPPHLSTEIATLCLDGLIGMANRTLTGAALGKFSVTVEAIDEHFYDQTNWRSNSEPFVTATRGMAHATALLEGSRPPNDRGYLPDKATSLVRLDEMASDEVGRALRVVNKSRDAFTPATIALFDNITDRIQAHRPTFAGRTVRTDTLPRFG